MASTNKTPNYDLPQFVAQDKPTWLGDVNDAFSKIDAGMEANKTSGESVVTRVTSLEETTSQHTTQIAEVTQTANTAGQTATAAQTAAETAGRLAQAAQGTADRIAESLNLDTVKYYNGTMLQTTSCTVEQRSNVWSARNNENTLGKVYGVIYVESVTGGSGSTPHNISIKIPQAFASIPSSFNIACAAIVFKYDSQSNLFPMYGFPGASVLTDGTLNIQFSAADVASDAGYVVFIPPCLYFIQDFGDKILDPTVAALAFEGSPIAARAFEV